jgi:hypothetical protein
MLHKPNLAILLDTFFANKTVSKQQIMDLLHISKDTFYKRMSGDGGIFIA